MQILSGRSLFQPCAPRPGLDLSRHVQGFVAPLGDFSPEVNDPAHISERSYVAGLSTSNLLNCSEYTDEVATVTICRLLVRSGRLRAS